VVESNKMNILRHSTTYQFALKHLRPLRELL